MVFEHLASPWLKKAGLCGALAEARGALHQAKSGITPPFVPCPMQDSA